MRKIDWELIGDIMGLTLWGLAMLNARPLMIAVRALCAYMGWLPC